MPTLQIRWDKAAIPVAGDAVARQLFDGNPRVSLFPARGKTARTRRASRSART
jgi:hypothetical protein